jgi:hypothetical protein
MHEHLSRGKAIWFLASIPAAVAIAASAASADSAPSAAPATADTAEATKMKTTLDYVDKSTTTGQSCANCTFFAATSDGDGTCKLITGGTVKAAGWCKSWSK